MHHHDAVTASINMPHNVNRPSKWTTDEVGMGYSFGRFWTAAGTPRLGLGLDAHVTLCSFASRTSGPVFPRKQRSEKANTKDEQRTARYPMRPSVLSHWP